MAVDAFHGFCHLVLFSFAKRDCDIKDTKSETSSRVLT